MRRRRDAGQVNRARLAGSTSSGRILRRNVLTILNATLFSVSVLLLAMGRVVDALFTAAPVAANVVAAVVLELRAKRQLDRLTLIHRPRVQVIRDGAEQQLDANELVLGDVVRLGRGDQAVVDGRVLAGAVEMDEAIVSGESAPVARRPGDPILSGSIAVGGSAAVETTHVGRETFASRLAEAARRGRDERTPLRRDLDTLILLIGIITLAVALLVALAMLQAGDGLLSEEAVRAAAVLVAFVPQGLAIMATVTYAVAAVRVSRAGAIVQRIDAAESMSRVDVLCLDKTGTLTSPRLVLDRLVVADGCDEAAVRSRIAIAAASVERGNRTLDAIASALPGSPRPVETEVPFSSLRQWSAVAVGGEQRALVFASPELLSAEQAGAPAMAPMIARLTSAGRRVVSVIDADPAVLADDGGLPAGRLLGLVALHEEIRPDAAATLSELSRRAVRLVILSGDDRRTVTAIARRVGLTVRRALSGADVRRRAAQLPAIVEEVDVFGRVAPDDKPAIVGALRDAGHHVGMVGDGVNDVLAMRRANLAVAMESGSPASRAVAGLVLLGDRFSILPYALTEGQRVVSAMIAVACLLLARTVYMLILVGAAVILGLPFPFTPTTNAVLAMVTVGLPILLLAMWVPPVRAPRSVVRRTLIYAVPGGLAVAALAVPLMAWAFDAWPIATARAIVTTVTVFAGIALIPIMFPVTRDRRSPVGWGGDPRPALMAGAMLLLFLAIMAVTPVRDLYELVALPTELLAGLFLASLLWAALVIGIVRLAGRLRPARASEGRP